MVTFPKADNVREVLPLIPRDRLLVETDTPYLAPVPYRGSRNEPAYVVEVARRLSTELGLQFDDLEAALSRSFDLLFTTARLATKEVRS